MDPNQSHHIEDRTKKVEGFMLPRKDWVSLNRFITDVEKCNLARINDARCDCWGANPDNATCFQRMSSNKICKEIHFIKGAGNPLSRDNNCKGLN